MIFNFVRMQAYPSVLAKFMRSVDSLCFEERPDYAAMRSLLMEEVKAEDECEDGEDEVFINLEISRSQTGSDDKENCNPQVNFEQEIKYDDHY